MTTPTLQFVRSRAHRDELAGALISTAPDFAAGSQLEDAGGGRWFLPEYRPADAMAGHAAARTTMTDEGTLTLFLLGGAPAVLAAANAAPRYDGLDFALVIDASGPARRIPLAAAREGDLWRLTAQLTSEDQKRVRTALFDTNPNLAIEVTQTLPLAALQSQAFVTANWSNPAVHDGLVAQFGGIPFTSPGMFYRMATGTASSYPQEYAIVQATYRMQVAVPPLPGYIQWQVDWQGRAHNYYQDSQTPGNVFYLPDRFELAKGPTQGQAVSLLRFTMPEGKTSIEGAQATFNYFGRPVTDGARMENAQQVLATRIGGAVHMLSIEGAHGVKATLTQYLPNAQATASDPIVQSEATIHFAPPEGVRNEVDLNFAQFRALWAAIFSAAPENPLFRGWVDVALLDGRFNDRVDFEARLEGTDEPGFFDSLLDTRSSDTYPAQFSVRTTAKALAGPPEVLEISAIFANATATLTADALTASVKVERSMRDIVLGRQDPGEYPYTLRIVREDGSTTCRDDVARRDAPGIWILAKQIEACTTPCA